MASITIRNLEDDLKSRLRVRAAQNGRSMEEEARHLLRAGLSSRQQQPKNLAEVIRSKFKPVGGVVLKKVTREPIRDRRIFES